MATKTKDQITVVCDGLFLNVDAPKPEEWKQSFPWKANVAFHFRVLDDAGNPTEEVHKKHQKEIWLFQAMGGKNARGHFFRCTTESGETQAGNPYMTVMPIAEVFADGSSHFIDPPKDGKITVPASTAKPKAPPPPAPAKAPASSPQAPKPPIPAKPAPLKPATEKAWKDANTAKAAAFFAGLDVPQSDPWWISKTQLGFDGADACNVLDHAKQMALIEVSKTDYGKEPDAGDAMRADANEAIDYWVGIMRTRLLSMKFKNIRERLSHHLTLCVSVDNVDQEIKKAWTELPESDFLVLRSEAIARVKAIQSESEDGVFKGKITGTLQPEVQGGQDFFAPDEPMSPEADGTVDTPQVEVPAEAATVKGPSADEIDFMVRGINNITDWKKLRDYWATTYPALQAVEEVKQAMRLWVADVFMRAKYQANVDGMIAKLGEMGLLNPETESTLNEQYAKLSSF